MKSRSIIRWTGYIECIARSANSYSVLVGGSKERKPLGNPSHRRQDNNKKTSSVYDCTVEDVEYIYNKLSIHI